MLINIFFYNTERTTEYQTTGTTTTDITTLTVAMTTTYAVTTTDDMTTTYAMTTTDDMTTLVSNSTNNTGSSQGNYDY